MKKKTPKRETALEEMLQKMVTIALEGRGVAKVKLSECENYAGMSLYFVVAWPGDVKEADWDRL